MNAKKNRYLLVITSSGGGGHLQAANAKIEEALSSDPYLQVISKDLLVDWVGTLFGKSFVNLWNRSQQKGNLKVRNFLSKNITAANYIFWTPIFLRTFCTLIHRNIDRVIDTQPVGTRAIIQAMRCVKKLTGRELTLEKVLTELPTEKTTYFFKSIKNLSVNDRFLIQLSAITPLLHPGMSRSSFWHEHCGLTEEKICYTRPPLRPCFKNYAMQKRHPKSKLIIPLKTHSLYERQLILDVIGKSSTQFERQGHHLLIHVEPTDVLATLLLGSHPTEEATLRYVKAYLDMAKCSTTHRRHLLFVFCSQIKQNDGLLNELHDLIEQTPDYPSRLGIVPMNFQDDDVIAPLYFRSDATFTRAGGLTAIELMFVSRGQIYIHSELKGKLGTATNLYQGMPLWEQGNAMYLAAYKGARLITPDTFATTCHTLFSPVPHTPNPPEIPDWSRSTAPTPHAVKARSSAAQKTNLYGKLSC